MKKFTPHSLALLIALLILVAAISLISIARWLSDYSESTVTVRTINTVSLPPPPPPPPPAQQVDVQIPTVAINTQGSGPQLTLNLVPPKVDIKQQPLELNLAMNSINWQESLDVDWQAFGLDQLDDLPRMLNKVKLNVPQQIRRQGVKKFDIALDVLINEQGQVTLLEVTQNPYPSFYKEIKRFVKMARFSAPSKNGEKVKARFIWPIEIEDL